jgi:hypothetical protein
MSTQFRCPACKRPDHFQEHLAPKPYVMKNGKIVQAGEYGVCNDCHAEQYRDVYGFTPEEAPAMAPPDDPFHDEYDDEEPAPTPARSKR